MRTLTQGLNPKYDSSEVISKEPLGPAVRRGDDEWFQIVRWSFNTMVEAEELGITKANADELRKTSANPNLQRLLGQSDDMGKLIGLDKESSCARTMVPSRSATTASPGPSSSGSEGAPAQPAPRSEPLVDGRRPDVRYADPLIRILGCRPAARCLVQKAPGGGRSGAFCQSKKNHAIQGIFWYLRRRCLEGAREGQKAPRIYGFRPC